MEFSTNVASIETEVNDAYTETIKMVEDDFCKFNEIVAQNLRIEHDIEKQLEKEDKKCTFLKHTVESLKKRLEDMERICTDQRNFIFDQQMEMEQISSTIYEQMEVKRIAYPEEDAIPYREMVKVVQRMVDCITNFKTTIQQNIEDCTNRNEETLYWKNTSNQLINDVSELKIRMTQLRSEIDQIASVINDNSLENMNKKTEYLQEIRRELKNMETSYHKAVTEKNKLGLWKQQVLVDSTDKKKLWSLTQENYEKLKKSSTNDINNLHMEIILNKQRYSDMMNEIKTSLDMIENEMCKYECSINEKSILLEDIISKESSLKCEDEKIILNVEKVDHELTILKESNQVLETQKILAKNMYDSMQSHNNALETSITEKEVQLKNLTDELADVVSNSNENALMDCNETEDLTRCIGPTELDTIRNHNKKLKEEREKQKQEENNLQAAEKELKFKLSASDVEVDFLNLLCNKIDIKVHEERGKVKKEMGDKIERCIENVNELSNIVIEKSLMLNSARADVQKYFNLIPLLENEIKAQSKENTNKRTKLSQIEEALNNEETNLKNKIYLLENLERNTFPKHDIPTEWLQSLQQQKDEYEKLRTERTKLEAKRNNLKKIAEKPVESSDLKLFNDVDSKKLRLDLEMKSAAYKMFKERIMKKRSTPPLG